MYFQIQVQQMLTKTAISQNVEFQHPGSGPQATAYVTEPTRSVKGGLSDPSLTSCETQRSNVNGGFKHSYNTAIILKVLRK